MPSAFYISLKAKELKQKKNTKRIQSEKKETSQSRHMTCTYTNGTRYIFPTKGDKFNRKETIRNKTERSDRNNTTAFLLPLFLPACCLQHAQTCSSSKTPVRSLVSQAHTERGDKTVSSDYGRELSIWISLALLSPTRPMSRLLISI